MRAVNSLFMNGLSRNTNTAPHTIKMTGVRTSTWIRKSTANGRELDANRTLSGLRACIMKK
jgi:hypothetical protein